jgi:hypothetical protein
MIESSDELKNTILSDDPEAATVALTMSESDKLAVHLCIAWHPGGDCPVAINWIKVGGETITPPGGIVDGHSDYRIAVGRHKRGTSLVISWSVRSWADLNGMRVFAHSTGNTRWTPLKKKQPLSYSTLWTDEDSYVVG